MANTFNCPSCSAPLETDGKETTIHCEYCGATVIVPPELRAQAAAESTPAPTPHPSQAEGPHGTLTSAEMRQMMEHIRAGRLDEATRTFQQGTGASLEMSGQTVQLIANQMSASRLILPAELAAIMRAYAESAGRAQPAAETYAGNRRRGVGCWLVLLIVALVFYFSYTAISPITLATALLAGKTGAPVVQTAIAPLHAIATAVAPLFH